MLLALLSLLFLHIRAPESLLGKEMLDFSHLPLFGLISYLLLLVVERKAKGPSRRSNKAFIRALLGTIILAGASELAQIYAQRKGDLNDFLYDMLGLLLVLGGMYVVQRRQPVLVGLYAVFALVSLSCTLYPIAQLGLAAPKYARAFPCLGSFEASWELIYWQPNYSSQIARCQEVSSEGVWSLKVVCSPCLYPGTQVSGFPKDWSAYKALRFKIYNPAADTLNLCLRIDSRAKTEPRAHRFSRSYAVYPGWNKKAVHIDDLAHAIGRAPHSIRLCIFFLYEPKQTTTFYLDNVMLSKQ